VKKLQYILADDKARDDLFEDGVASLVTECRGIVRDRLAKAFSAVSSEILAEQLWQGSIDPRSIQQALLGLGKLHVFLAELSVELSGLAAGVFKRPVLLDLAGAQPNLLPGGCPAGVAKVLGEQLAWSTETHILNRALMEACSLVWNRAVSDCAWPVRRLKPGKLLWRLTGFTPADEKKRCLQELTRSVKGLGVSMQKRLFKEICFQVATQVWSLYDGVSQEKNSGDFLDPETSYCA
jgi:hypothetical protein